LLAFLLIALPGVHQAFAAAPAVTTSPTVGPPTTKTTVSGSGFGSIETVDVLFNLTRVGSATTDATGAFSLVITVPNATPGLYPVRARGETSRLSAITHYLVRTDWSQFQFSAGKTGYNPYENLLTPSTVGNLTLKWTLPTGGPIGGSPAVSGGVVYIGSQDSYLYAIEATTGHLLWAGATSGAIEFSSPAVADGRVFVGTDSGSFYAFSASGCGGHLCYPLWSVSLGTYAGGIPTVSGALVYILTHNGVASILYALDAATGAVRWDAVTGCCTPAVVTAGNGFVYVASQADRDVEAFRAGGCGAPSCTPVWTVTGEYFLAASAANGVVYVTSGICCPQTGNLMALDGSTGTQLWTYNTGGGFSPPAVANGMVYDAANESVYAIGATQGALIWSSTPGTAISGTPVVAGRVLYMSTSDQRLALDAETGQTLWTASVTSGANSAAVANGIVYFPSPDHYVYAYGL
jgi:outer membrane protein assembly factor BamB